MCIIVYKPKNKKNPKEHVLQQCWNNNQDGAGIAVWNNENNLWDVEKGFMKWKDFWNRFKELNLTKQDTYVIHFRVGTSGWIDAGNTHPFPLSTDYDKMRQTKFSTPNIVFHNGTVSHIVNTMHNDTMEWIKKYVYGLQPYIFDDPKLEDVLKYVLQLSKCRWLITKGPKIMTLGEWHTGKKGVKFSNKYFNENKPASVKTTGVYTPPAITVYDKRKTKNMTSVPNRTTHSFMYNAPAKKLDSVNDNWQDKKNVSNGNIKHDIPIKTDDKTLACIDEFGNIVWENKEYDTVDALSCPNCFEDTKFAESDFNVGDTICLECGAVFDDHSGIIFAFDDDALSQSKIA